MVNIKRINVRCFNAGWLLSALLLASKERGANQHLNIISGVDIVSEPSINESLCQEADQCLLTNITDTMEITALCEIEVAQSFSLGTTMAVIITPADKNNKVIIIICLLSPF